MCARNVEGSKMFCIFLGQNRVSKTLKLISTCQRCYLTLIFWNLKTKKKTKKKINCFLGFLLRFNCRLPPLCAKAPLSGGTRSRWLGGPAGFPPPATLLIGKFTSLQGTTDSPVNQHLLLPTTPPFFCNTKTFKCLLHRHIFPRIQPAEIGDVA